MTVNVSSCLYKRNAALVLTTSTGSGVIGAGTLRHAQTGVALDDSLVTVQGSAVTAAGTVLYGPLPATLVSVDATGARWDFILPETLFSGANGSFTGVLRIFDLSGTVQYSEFLVQLHDQGQ